MADTANDLEITIFSQDRCVQCKATKRQFGKDEVPYEELDATLEENNEFAKSLGYMQAPVTVVRRGGEIVDHWSGFRPDKHEVYKAAFAPAEQVLAAA